MTMFNWPGNDYRDASIIDRPRASVAAALQDAKRVSLGFLHWLQTEAPRRGGARAPRAQAAARRDGHRGRPLEASLHPRARRIAALRTVVEQDVSAEFQPGPRAAHFADSVGIGWYPIDIHRSGPEDVGVSCRTRPFQIPLGALIPVARNLVAAAKNIGTTHITNGCYRLHPVEWNIGEAAGALADWSLARGQSPERIWRDGGETPSIPATPAGGRRAARLGHRRATRRPGFVAVQTLAVGGVPVAPEALELFPGAPLEAEDMARLGWDRRAAGDAGSRSPAAGTQDARPGRSLMPGLVGVDSYTYHRLLGEVRPGEMPPLDLFPRGSLDVVAEAPGSGSMSRSSRRASWAIPRVSHRRRIRARQEGSRSASRGERPRASSSASGADALDDLFAWLPRAAALGSRSCASSQAGRPSRAVARSGRGSLARSLCRGPRPWCRLALENHGDLTAAQVERLLEQVGADLRVCFDTANALRVGDNVAAASRRLAAAIAILHLKDCAGGWYDPLAGPVSVPLGEGVVPIEAVLEACPHAVVCIELGQLARSAEERALVGSYVEYLGSR